MYIEAAPLFPVLLKRLIREIKNFRIKRAIYDDDISVNFLKYICKS